MELNDKVTAMSTNKLLLFWALFVWDGGREAAEDAYIKLLSHNMLYVSLKQN